MAGSTNEESVIGGITDGPLIILDDRESEILQLVSEAEDRISDMQVLIGTENQGIAVLLDELEGLRNDYEAFSYDVIVPEQIKPEVYQIYCGECNQYVKYQSRQLVASNNAPQEFVSLKCSSPQCSNRHYIKAPVS